jgi:hypothetical protein
LGEAEDVLIDSQARQDAVNAALSKLQGAVDGLTEESVPADKSTLQSLYGETVKIYGGRQNEFTTGS